MRVFPPSEVYEQVFQFMPWGSLIKKVLQIIERDAPVNGSLLDLMCGPGYLLGEITKQRSDLHLGGVDNNEAFIQHARQKYPSLSFHVADVLSYVPKKQYDLLLSSRGGNIFLPSIRHCLLPNGHFPVLSYMYLRYLG